MIYFEFSHLYFRWENFYFLLDNINKIPLMIPISLYKDFQKKNVESFTQNNTKIPQLDLLHSVIGLCEEFIEYKNATSEEHKIEELGDLLFYHTVLSHMLGIDPKDFLEIENQDEISRDELLGSLLGKTKKYVFHGKPIYKAEFQKYLNVILKHLDLHTFNITYVMEYNINKLQKRYPNGRADNIFNKLHTLTLNII